MCFSYHKVVLGVLSFRYEGRKMELVKRFWCFGYVYCDSQSLVCLRFCVARGICVGANIKGMNSGILVWSLGVLWTV